MARRSADDERVAVIAVGASAGGVDAISTVVAGLPADLRAAVLVVLHVSPRGKSVLPHILSSRGPLPARHATDGERLEAGRVYVAPPDQHLVVEPGRVRLTDEPRENGVRPSVDTLFRSAAHAYGPLVIGVVLSGTLDDGTAGLMAIKQHGGVAVVQDPAEAVFPSMPANAARFADPDHVVPLDKVPALLASIVDEWSEERRVRVQQAEHDDEQPGDASAAAQRGDPSEFTCPECGGTLWEQQEGDLLRFRCRVGHAYSTESLLADQREALEAALWGAVVALEERADLANRLAGRMEDRGRAHRAGRYVREAGDARRRAGIVREAIAHLSQAESDVGSVDA
ncbi:MAG: chemotaxis protein CheB [Actinobacteria bacterium]|nr:MAG: chemotaxis protein CheB [Actinomycetota bacterium]